jgi:tRNA-splicing ligase RtcB
MTVSTTKISVFGSPVDEKALAQIENVADDERVVAAALMADHHLGYSMPIGGVAVYDNAISPSGVGFDIACGNKAAMTNLLIEDMGVSE